VPLILTGRQRRHLRALAHEKKPVVQVGHSGLTPGVLDAIEAALLTHELIKVRVLAECPEDTAEIGPKLESATGATLAQEIGRTLLLYRRRAKDPKITLPPASSPNRE
jgi:RNA-binding protein